MLNKYTIEEKKEIYSSWIKKIKEDKIAETLKKRERFGYMDADDYNNLVIDEDYHFTPILDDGEDDFNGFLPWARNYKALTESWPPVAVPYSSMCGNYFILLNSFKKCDQNKKFDYSHLKDRMEKYCLINAIGQYNHFCGDPKILLNLGFGGLLKKIDCYEKLNAKDKDTIEFYQAERMLVEATIAWINRTSGYIGKLIREEKDPLYKENLEEMLVANTNIATGIPQNMREACQLLSWYNVAGRAFTRDGAGCQLDEILLPYYKADIDKGLIDDEDAIFFIVGLLMSDTKYHQLGGRTIDGKDRINHLSYLIIEAANRLDVALNLTVRVHKDMDDKFFSLCIKMLFKHKNGWPRFSGDDSLVNGLMRRGFSEEIARKRIAVGCNWMATPGVEYCLQDTLKVNFAKIFEISFKDMMKGEVYSLDILWSLFLYHLHAACDTYKEMIDFHYKVQKYTNPELFLNLFVEGPIEKGRDASDNSIQYYNIGMEGAGIAVAADSFAAIEQRVIKEKKISFKELDEALTNNFSNDKNRYIQALLKSSEKYGQENSLGLAWAIKIKKAFEEYVLTLKSNNGGIFTPGLFSWSLTIQLGKDVGATPDGRKAGEPINHGANPFPASIKNGEMTTLSNAIASVQCLYGNTSPFQMELDPMLGENESSINKVKALIKTHLELGGTLVNVNILDKEKILKANENPLLYPDLVVRVTGFTAYFATLSPEFRKLVVDRIISAQ